MYSKSEALKQFHGISNLRGTWDLVWRYSFAAGLIYVAVHTHNLAVAITCFILISATQQALLNLQHDAWHQLCFTPKRANDIITSWFYAYALGSAFYYNQVRHRGHHAYFGTENDPDHETYSNTGRDTPLSFLLFLAKLLLAYRFVDGALMVVRSAKNKDASKSLPGMDLRSERTPSLKTELACLATAQLLILGVFYITTGSILNYVFFWLLPMYTLANFLSVFRRFMEHANATTDGLAPADRLFDYQPSVIEKFFVSPAHFELHAFHHTFPKIPHYKLYQARAHALENKVHFVYTQRGTYFAALIEHINGLRKNKNASTVVENGR